MAASSRTPNPAISLFLTLKKRLAPDASRSCSLKSPLLFRLPCSFKSLVSQFESTRHLDPSGKTHAAERHFSPFFTKFFVILQCGCSEIELREGKKNNPPLQAIRLVMAGLAHD